MGRALYLQDAYLREFRGEVAAHRPAGVELEPTAFYPTGGGQPCDRGTLEAPDGRRWTVQQVEKEDSGTILHRIDGELPPLGLQVTGRLDWELRYRHMRYHTCLHILSGVVHRRFGSGITGGQIYADRARMDLSLPELSRDLAEQVVEEVNGVVKDARPVEVRFLSREKLAADPSLVRVAPELLPDVPEVRLIDIVGFDVQADGGTHVRSTAEVGPVSLLRIENKGARNKRLYVGLEATPPVAPAA